MAGLNEAALRFISESLALGETGLARAYLNRSLKTVVFASGLAAIVATGGFAVLRIASGNAQQPLALLALVAVGVTVLAWQQLGAELLRAYGDMRLASLFSGGQTGGPLSNLLFLTGLCAATFATAKIDATLAAGITVGSCCLTCPLVYLALSRLSRVPSATPVATRGLSQSQRRELLAVGSVLLASQLLAFATQQFDIWLAGGLLTPEALGLYGAAKRSLLMAAMPVQMATLTIVSTIPRLHAHGRTAELERRRPRRCHCCRCACAGRAACTHHLSSPNLEPRLRRSLRRRRNHAASDGAGTLRSGSRWQSTARPDDDRPAPHGAGRQYRQRHDAGRCRRPGRLLFRGARPRGRFRGQPGFAKWRTVVARPPRAGHLDPHWLADSASTSCRRTKEHVLLSPREPNHAERERLPEPLSSSSVCP